MDRSLDEIISERPNRPRGGGNGGGRRPERRGPPPAPRAPRREEYPRDGVRKPRRDDRPDIDADWVHDKFEDDHYERSNRRRPNDYDDQYDDRQDDRRGTRPALGGTRIRIDNLHYELTEADLRELFERIGDVQSVRILYDRSDRSQGIAFVTYEHPDDARRAIADYDGCNANGQPIRLTAMANAPPPQAKSIFDRITGPARGLANRNGGDTDDDAGDRRPRRRRSESPRASDRLAPYDDDRRGPPARRSRSPMRRRGGGGREQGRRPGARRDEAGRGGGGGGRRPPRTDEDGHKMVGGRPRKTAEELDAEMADYWGKKNADATEGGAGGADTAAVSNGNGAGDIDMDLID